MKYVCDVCGWEYDEEEGYPEGGIAPGTKWEDVPEDFECPLCNVGKDQFSEVEQKPNLVLNTDGQTKTLVREQQGFLLRYFVMISQKIIYLLLIMQLQTK